MRGNGNMWVTVKAIKELDNKTCWCTLQELLREYLYAPMVLWWSHYSSFLCLVLTLLVLVLRLMPNAAHVSALFILDCSSVFSNVYLSCVLCPMLPMSLYCPFLIALRFSLTFVLYYKVWFSTGSRVIWRNERYNQKP